MFCYECKWVKREGKRFYCTKDGNRKVSEAFCCEKFCFNMYAENGEKKSCANCAYLRDCENGLFCCDRSIKAIGNPDGSSCVGYVELYRNEFGEE